MIRSLAVDAPAKINLFLRILHPRADGYREVETLYQSLTLADRVTVSWDDSGEDTVRLAVEGPDLGPDGENLAVPA